MHTLTFTETLEPPYEVPPVAYAPLVSRETLVAELDQMQVVIGVRQGWTWIGYTALQVRLPDWVNRSWTSIGYFRSTEEAQFQLDRWKQETLAAWDNQMAEAKAWAEFEASGKPAELVVEHELPAHWVICGACGGEGKELYGSLKGADVTNMIAEDPEFGEAYRAGRYDVPCSCCNGLGKVLEVDEERLGAHQRTFWQRHLESRRAELAEDIADRHTRRQERGGFDG